MEDVNPRLMRLGFAGVMLFLMSGSMSCTEARYYFSKKDATARVVDIYEKTGRRSRHVGWTVAYTFHNEDANEQQKGFALVGDDAVGLFSVGQELPIEYLGSANQESRIKGESNMGWVYVFLGSMGFCAVTIAVLTWQSMREEKKGRLS
jgi:hypothetical protein